MNIVPFKLNVNLYFEYGNCEIVCWLRHNLKCLQVNTISPRTVLESFTNLLMKSRLLENPPTIFFNSQSIKFWCCRLHKAMMDVINLCEKHFVSYFSSWYLSPLASRESLRMHFSNCTHFILMVSSTIHLKNFQVLLLCFFLFHVLDRISARTAVVEYQCSIAVRSFTIFLHSFLKCAFSMFMIFLLLHKQIVESVFFFIAFQCLFPMKSSPHLFKSLLIIYSPIRVIKLV